MTLVAVDGGQSATRLRVLPDGRCGNGPGYTHQGGVAGLVDAVRVAADEAGIRGGPVEVVCLGLTGLPPERPAADLFAAEVSDVLGATEVRLCTDLVTAHAGALPDGYGVVLTAGTGVACLAVGIDGTWHRVDGHGYVFGDLGSAFAIGRDGLTAVLRARDGCGPMTSLAGEAVAAHPTSLYTSPTMIDDIAQFAPQVLRHAAVGDEVAQAIVDRAAADLAATVTAAIAWMGGDAPVPVACVGGLLAAGHQLWKPFADQLPARAVVQRAIGSALDGAARLAGEPSDHVVRRYIGQLTIHRTRPARSRRP